MIPNALVERLLRHAVWHKGDEIPGYNAALFRKDEFGNWIAWDEYGRHSDLGWEIDHHAPPVSSGDSVLAHLRPVHWRVNAGVGGKRHALLAR